MKRRLIACLFLTSIIYFISGCSKKKGCTDPISINYDATAEEDDGSCQYSGCTDPSSINYNSKATVDDGSCQYAGCTDSTSANYNPNATVDDGSCQYAGLGGNTNIVGFPRHHGVPILNQSNYLDSAFVKFNAVNSPGTSTSDYDIVFAGDPGEDHVHMIGLKPGRYFIMMTGWDPNINERVVGGMPYTLTQTSGDVNLVVSVTE